MKLDKLFKNQKEINENIQKSKLIYKNFNFEQILKEKIKQIKDENIDLNILYGDSKLNEAVTTSTNKSSKNSQTNIFNFSDFNKYNFSNFNNIRKIYLRHINYFSTELDNKNSNRSFNNYSKEQKNYYIKRKYRNNNNIRNILAPIYENYFPSKLNKSNNVFNNYINMNLKKEKDEIKPCYISHNKYLKHSNKNKNYSNFQKYLNYFPYIEKIKKIRLNNSNDKIFTNSKFNNSTQTKRIPIKDYFDNSNKINNSYSIYKSPLDKESENYSLNKEEQTFYQPQKYIILDVVKDNKNKTTNHKSNKLNYNKYKNHVHHKQLSLRKYFGDNYNYFERNESPVKIDKTFHKRRSPAHVFGYENYIILEDSNDRLVASSIDNFKKLRRLNSEGNNSRINLFN